MISTVIIDDEQLARDVIKNYLKDYSDIEIVEECENGFEGLKAIQEYHPDLVFLDIKMPKITGFEMLELLDTNPVIIFCTALDQYAIKAFEHNAADYLLKPYSKERFAEAVEKAKEKVISRENQEEKIDNLLQFARNSIETIRRIVVKLGSKIHIIPVDAILYIEAQDDYVMIYTEDGRFLKQNTMKYLEAHLPENEFVRIHRSFIVAVKEIVRLEGYEKESHLVILKNNSQLNVSRTGYSRLKEVLKI